MSMRPAAGDPLQLLRSLASTGQIATAGTMLRKKMTRQVERSTESPPIKGRHDAAALVQADHLPMLPAWAGRCKMADDQRERAGHQQCSGDSLQAAGRPPATSPVHAPRRAPT